VTSEADAVDRAGAWPVTVDGLAADLEALGVRRGSVVLAHSSLSALGWVAGGAAAVVDALLRTLGPEGTLVVPTQTGDLSDPAAWQRPPVPEAWWPVIRASLPAYRPDATLPRSMGAIPLAVLLRTGVVRSAHPQVSFAALGPLGTTVVAGQLLEDGLGESSPLGRIHDLDGDVLLLGVGHDVNTSLHLAEHRAAWPSKARESQGAPVLVDGERRWATWDGLGYDADDFAAIGEDLVAAGLVRTGPVGSGTGQLMRQRPVVERAAAWISANRS
jgi:aminoglycoside 3-N-acetyltransferase